MRTLLFSISNRDIRFLKQLNVRIVPIIDTFSRPSDRHAGRVWSDHV
jgi:hypothetical protein